MLSLAQAELENILTQLIDNWEDEIVEFKQAGVDYSSHEIGKYFSALANEANLRGYEKSWLVFGVNNKTRAIVGSNYRSDPERLQSTKMQIAENTEPKTTFRNIFELMTERGRIIMFEIPAAAKGIPISWKGHYYARAGESLTALSIDKQDQIRNQTVDEDWSVELVNEATVEDLDPEALAVAKKAFLTKYGNRIEEATMEGWSINTFLEKLQLVRNGKITKAAILLLGKPESASLLTPHPAQLTWKLVGQERAYEHFGTPFLLNTTKLYQKIRNIQIRILPDDTLFPVEVSKYDQKVILEALHNCIAHQDYRGNARVVVTESLDKLLFENVGTFFDGQPDEYFYGNRTPSKYRNTLLAHAMVELNMIDTMGFGIYDMHRKQADRYFPLPDYDLTENQRVRLTIYGKIIDPEYSKLLIKSSDLAMGDIILLDRVQKGIKLDKEQSNNLRKKKLIEGRKPNIHISAKIAHITSSKVEYIKTKAQDDIFYSKLILDYLHQWQKASREDIDNLLIEKLTPAMTFEQKNKKIENLLTKLRRRGQIVNAGSKKYSEWILADKKK